MALAALGSLKLAHSAVTSIGAIAKYFLVPRRNLKARYGEGSWALITGSSDGIGKQYCYELAREGFNIILMGRDKQKTEGVAKEVAEQTGVQTKAVIYDFAILETEETIK